MPGPDPLTLPLEERLMESIITWFVTPIDAGIDPDGKLEAARQVLANNVVYRRKDEDTVITPQSDEAKKIRLIVIASDEGRTMPYAPIRNIGLVLKLRANSKLVTGQVDPFLAAEGALETLMDGINLQRAWSSADYQIAVMLAVRSRAKPRLIHGDIRTDSCALAVKAVGREHTSS